MMPSTRPGSVIRFRARARGRAGAWLRRAGLWLVLVLGLSLAGATVQADSNDERRIRAGARLFRALLAADVGLEAKTDKDGSLRVLVLGNSESLGNELRELIAPPESGDGSRIRGLPLKVETGVRTPEGAEAAPAAVFLATAATPPELAQIVRWGIANRVIVYSPFEGDVERGALGGLSIEAKVQPYVNLSTLRATGVELKPFFLKVAKVHP